MIAMRTDAYAPAEGLGALLRGRRRALGLDRFKAARAIGAREEDIRLIELGPTSLPSAASRYLRLLAAGSDDVWLQRLTVDIVDQVRSQVLAERDPIQAVLLAERARRALPSRHRAAILPSPQLDGAELDDLMEVEIA